MEEFRKFCAAIAGTAAMVFLIICCVADDHLSEWTLIKTNLAFNEEQSVFENVDTPQYYILKKEYDKLYIRYSKKYSSSELNYILYNKLLSKGYKSDDINNVIKNKF